MPRSSPAATRRLSEVGALKRLVMMHPREALRNQATIATQWQPLGYAGPPDFKRAVTEYDGFVELLEAAGATIDFITTDTVGLDAMYTRDASVVCADGVMLCSMGKQARRSEPGLHEALYRRLEVPIVGAIAGDGWLEGGDVVWLDHETVAVGRGYRTNDDGIRQFQQLVGTAVREVIVVPLPHWRGPQDVFHLMSIVSPIDVDLCLVYSPLLPVAFREALLSRGIELVEVPDEEFATMACNVLALAPRRSVMLEGNPQTRKRLRSAGVDVVTFDGAEICLKGGGGPTCLTRPLVREAS